MVDLFAAIPLGAYAEGVDQGHCGRVLFNYDDRPTKKLITNLNNISF
jgi:hypothetical protein